MILVRVVFQAGFGKGGALAAALKQSMSQMATGQVMKGRILTDLSGDFDTVVMESEHDSLAAWEQTRSQMFSDPQWQAGAAGFYDLAVSGRQEYWTIEAEL